MVKSRSHHDIAHLHPLTNVPNKYQLPTPYGFRDIAQTRFYRSRSLRQGKRSNQGHTMMLHTYTTNQCPYKYQLPTSYGFRDIAWTRFYRSRSLRQGQTSNQGHTMTLHTYRLPGNDFQTQGHCGKVKSRTHHGVAHLYPLTNVPTKYKRPP